MMVSFKVHNTYIHKDNTSSRIAPARRGVPGSVRSAREISPTSMIYPPGAVQNVASLYSAEIRKQ